jgi:hypothetical protein
MNLCFPREATCQRGFTPGVPLIQLFWQRPMRGSSICESSGRIVADSYIGLIWRSEQLWRHDYREVGLSTAMFSAAEAPR